MTQKMEAAFRRKDANAILAFISPASGTRVANLSHDQLRLLLVRYFRNSDHLSANLNNYAFASGDADATLQFDLIVHNDGSDSRNQDYTGHITLHFKRVENPHLLGLYQTKEWRIAAAESTGFDISTFGD